MSNVLMVVIGGVVFVAAGILFLIRDVPLGWAAKALMTEKLPVAAVKLLAVIVGTAVVAWAVGGEAFVTVAAATLAAVGVFARLRRGYDTPTTPTSPSTSAALSAPAAPVPTPQRRRTPPPSVTTYGLRRWGR